MDIDHLARLARIAIDPGEKEKLSKDLESILRYVSELESVKGVAGSEGVTFRAGDLVNVLREDADAIAAKTHTEDLVAAAPKRRGDFVVVKKILEK